MDALIRLAALLFLVLMEVSCCEGCWKQERDSLLDFKARFSDPDPAYLSTPEPFINWVDGTDCCQWEGVQCNSTTRRVVKLTLDGARPNPYLNLSDFLVFEDLQTLVLRENGIGGCVGNGGLERRKFSKLEVLDLSYNGLGGTRFNIMSCFSALSSLKSLDLSDNGLTAESFRRVKRRKFSKLEVLDLSNNELGGTSFNIVSCFSALSSLKSLDLSYNDLTAESFRSLDNSSLRNLEVLDLSRNSDLTNDILLSLGNLTYLKTLHLRGIDGLDSQLNFSGLVSKLIKLEVLDMSDNDFSQAEYIFSSLSGLSSLKSLILQNCKLTSKSISGLSKLYSLEVLDLSGNDLNINFRTLFPRDNGRLPWPTSLEVLALSNNGFGNYILPSLNGLQRLKSLDLGYNNLEGSLDITGIKIPSSLKVLILDGMNIDANMLRKSLKAFSSITMLSMKYSKFKGTVTARDFAELSNLKNLVLDYSSNLLNEFFISIGALTSLKVLSMEVCWINGTLPSADWSNLKKLEELDISDNEFKGLLPPSFCNMTSLRKLDLSGNGFTGNLAPNLAGLTSLEYIDFTGNQFEIPASFSFFVNLSYLKFIHGQGNNVILDHYPTSQSWVPRFQLQELILATTTQTSSIPFPSFLLYQNALRLVDVSGCKFGGVFPNWLLVNNTKMTNLNLRNNSFTGHVQFPSHPTPNIQSIDVSDNAISGPIPGSNMSSIFPKLHFLNMSRNEISGSLPHELGLMKSLITLDLSHNNLSGEIPTNISASGSLIRMLILSNNKFSGQISPLLALHHLSYLRLDGNCFSGIIPSSLSNLSRLSYLDLSNNHFVGNLPRLIWHSSYLQEFSMSNNHLEGSIPKEFGGLSSLDLSGNNLSGPIPSFINSSLAVIFLSNNRLSCLTTGMFRAGQEVQMLDLSNNEITGTIQDVIGNIGRIHILLLKGNQFRGHIPKKLCNLTYVTILDFSHNGLSGSIPNCLGELPFNPNPLALLNLHFRYGNLYPPSIVLRQANFTTKNNAYKYDGNILGYMTGMDLSHNKLDGNIPFELGNMTGIRALNLSHNDITGHIPSTLSNLKQIESLDFSLNKLSGRIPPELTQLTSLEVFSVAHNNLSGATPDRKGQFITFDERSYEDNPFLCGPPLRTSCGDPIGQPSPPSPSAKGDTDSGFMDMEAFYIGMAISWTMVLLVMVAVLSINPYWRRAWSYFVEYVINTCYYFIIDHFPKLC